MMMTMTTEGSMSAPIRSDPYREPAPEPASRRPRFERLNKILGRLGLWRFRWIRKALGGRWERFDLLKWIPQEVDDYLWLEAVNANESPAVRCRFGAEFPQMRVGVWHRVLAWSVFEPPTMMRITIGDRSLSIGTMRFIEFLGSRLAVVSYYREDH